MEGLSPQQRIDYLFSSQTLTSDEMQICDELRADFAELASRIMDKCPDGSTRDLILTKIEETSMWAIKSISHG